MKRTYLATVLAFWCCLSSAAPTPTPVRAEIDALLSRLESSGCQFYRNGSWYSGSEAKHHLLNKLDYMEGRITVQSTEQFIDLAASQSSLSGKPYEVKCNDTAAVRSRPWLIGLLASIRSSVEQLKP